MIPVPGTGPKWRAPSGIMAGMGSRPLALPRAAGLLLGLLLATGIARATGADEAPSFSVVTLNLWHDKGDWPKRQAMITAALRRLQPDVIALQEVLQDTHLPNQAVTLAAALGYRHVFVSVDPPDAPRRYGNAVLTRHALVAEGWKALRPFDDYRTVAHVRIGIGARELDVYATHLHFTEGGRAIRREQVGDLLDYVRDTTRGAASIIVGDFNAPADAPEFDVLRADYRDAYDLTHPQAAQDAPAHSTLNPAYLPALRVDHVLFDRRTLSVAGARRLLDAPDADGTWASDHFGVLATLRFEGPAAPATR